MNTRRNRARRPPKRTGLSRRGLGEVEFSFHSAPSTLRDTGFGPGERAGRGSMRRSGLSFKFQLGGARVYSKKAAWSTMKFWQLLSLIDRKACLADARFKSDCGPSRT
jgi:hypothetical protein